MPRLSLPVIYEAVDRHVAGQDRELATAGHPVSCETGCAHCCYLLVTIMFEEAVEIVRYLHRLGRLDDFLTREGDRLSQLAELVDQPGTNQATYVQLQERCPFLAPNDTCTVYEVRPMACRLHSALSPKEDCSVPGGTISTPDRRALRADALAASAQSSLVNGFPPVMLPLPLAIRWAAIYVLSGRQVLEAAIANHPCDLFGDPDMATLYWARLETNDGRTYEVRTNRDGNEGIGCRICGSVSYRPEDIRHRYCGECRLYHDERRRGAPPQPEEA